MLFICMKATSSHLDRVVGHDQSHRGAEVRAPHTSRLRVNCFAYRGGRCSESPWDERLARPSPHRWEGGRREGEEEIRRKAEKWEEIKRGREILGTTTVKEEETRDGVGDVWKLSEGERWNKLQEGKRRGRDGSVKGEKAQNKGKILGQLIWDPLWSEQRRMNRKD